MSAFVKLLGENLVGQDAAELKTADVLNNKKAVALYFSAHWCPPCRGFTPQLAEKYKTTLKEKSLEIVFVSSDKDESTFKEYFAEMPWLSLPYSDRDTKAALSKRFKVQGIPCLVILDGATGDLITREGRSKIDDMENFPWTPKPFSELLGSTFIAQGGAHVGLEAVKDKILGLYFSAHWCPPCRGFTPELAKVYTKVKANHPNFELIFVSSDSDESAFKEYFETMPWLALPYDKRQEKEALSSLFEINGIPSLVIVQANDGRVINKNARSLVGADKEGENFPWAPKLVNDIAISYDGIDEYPSFIAFGLEEGTREEVEKVVNIIADELHKTKTDPSEEDEFRFFLAKDPESGGTMGQIKTMCGLDDKSEVKGGILLDLEDNGAFYEFKNALTSPDALRSFLEDFKDGKLERKQVTN